MDGSYRPPPFIPPTQGHSQSQARHNSHDTATTICESEGIAIDADASYKQSPRPSFSLSSALIGLMSDEVHVAVAPPQVAPAESIDACTFSPDSKHVAAYSAKAGHIAIWLVNDLLQNTNAEPVWQSNSYSTQLRPRNYWESRPSFTPSFLQGRLMTNVDFALSNEAKYVALSAIKLPQDPHDPEPFELVNSPPDIANKFFTFVVKTTRNRPLCKRKLVRLKGSIKFLSDGQTFVVCNVEYDEWQELEQAHANYVYVWSTQPWRVLRKLVIDTFTVALQVIPHPWTQIGVVKCVLLDGFFMFVEQWNAASLWSMSTAQLVTRFKCLPNDTFLDADSSPTLFALSNNKEMLATWTSKGILTIFLCEGGIVFASSTDNNDCYNYSSSIKREIMWLEGDEYITTVNSVGTDQQRVEIWDIYSCRMVYMQSISQNCTFQPNGSGTYISFKEDVLSINKVIIPKNAATNISNASLGEKEILGRHNYMEGGFTRIYDYNQQLVYESGPGYEREMGMSMEHSIVEYRTEPWEIFTPTKSVFILDERKERILYISRYTVQLWIFQQSKKPRLQYIWCKPTKHKGSHWRRTVYATIENATLYRVQDGRYLLEVHAQISPKDKRSFSKFTIQRTNDFPLRDHIAKMRNHGQKTAKLKMNSDEFTFNLMLPLEGDRATFDIVGSAAYALGFLATAERKYRIQLSAQKINAHYNYLRDQTREIILNAIHNNSYVFNEIKHSQSCIEILIKADCKDADAMIGELLKSNKHIPRFHDAERRKSSLRRAIAIGKTEVVHALLDYYVRRSEENPVSWMTTVVPALPALTRMYPDIVLDLMKSISYHLSGDDIVRTNSAELYAFSRIEDRDSKESLTERLRVWFRRGEKKIDQFVVQDILQLPQKTHPAKECVVPLPDFTVYRYLPPKDAKKMEKESPWPWGRRMLDSLQWQPERSVFVREILLNRPDIFDAPVMEAILNFKWRKFARTRVFCLLAFNFAYFTVFMIGVSSPNPAVRSAVIPAILFFGSGFLLLQLLIMINQAEHYWYSPYNWVELANTILPLTFAGLGAPAEDKYSLLIGTSMFFVYMNLILQLRVFQPVGVPTYIIFEIFRKVFWFNVLVATMVLAFAHIFMMLLKDSTDPNLSSWNSYGQSLLAVYFFFTGSFDSINDALDQPIIAVLVLFYSIFTTIVLMNVLIALMTDVVSQTDGKRAWLRQKAEVITRVEMYLLTPKQRMRKDFFPSLIYYYASPDNIRDYKTKLARDNAKKGGLYNLNKECKNNEEDHNCTGPKEHISHNNLATTSTNTVGHSSDFSDSGLSAPARSVSM